MVLDGAPDYERGDFLIRGLIDIDDEEVDSVGGLLAKHLGKVPIPGSVVQAHGLRFEAEQAAGRRNKIGTVLISRVPVEADEDE